jgi:hypothetical protein
MYATNLNRTFTIAALAAMTILFASAAMATEPATNRAVQPVTDYGPPSDLDAHPLPPLPKLGPAGHIFTEPTFGYRILRVTDENTLPGNRSFVVKYPGVMFNCDSTRFYVCDVGGGEDIPFSFDPANLKATRIGDSMMSARAYFSPTDPDVIYGMEQMKYPNAIVKYNFKTQSYTQLLDVAKCVPGMKGGIGAISISATEEIALECNGEGQDKFRTVLWYDLSTGKNHVLDTVDKTIDAKPMIQTNFWSGIHDVQIIKGGRYVQICTNPTQADRGGKDVQLHAKAGYWFWDTQTNKCYFMDKEFDHWAAGYGCLINKGWGILQLRTFGPEGMSEPVSFLPAQLPSDAHESWNNAQPGKLLPVIVETCRAGPMAVNNAPYAPLDEEIFAVSTDGSKKIWRFAHDRIRDKNWFYGPNISQDGRFCLFTSTWEESLGKDSNGKPRYDVFLIELIKPERK